ncbi:MAG: tRNA-uridine aminocarboxypropyltransferase, partial [Polyangiaceae bacterium]
MIPSGAPQNAFESRAECYRCHKPQLTCICGHVDRIANRTGVWVMQHPRERFHPIGTARIARLGLSKVHVEVLHSPMAAPPPVLPPGAGLLYPHPHARDLSTLPADERPEDLIVIDGTWSQAHTVYRDNPWLQHRPHYQLTPQRPSRYRLRKEPTAQCLSTIEAIVEALRILEPDTSGLDSLLASFDALIDRQLELTQKHQRGPRQPSTPRTHRGAPRCLIEQANNLVAVSFECAPRDRSGRDPLALAHVVALRVATGEVFEHFVRPPEGRFPRALHLKHMGIELTRLETGSSQQELGAAWQRFVADEDIVVAWNQSVLDALESAIGLPKRQVHLKSAFRSHAKRARGSLLTLVQQLRLDVSPHPKLVGRAGEHVAN